MKLKWQMALDETGQILIIQTSGVLNIESATVMRHEVAAMLTEHGYRYCLLDHSALEAEVLETPDIYQLPQRYKELGISRTVRMAVVVPKQFMRNLKFYETVCRNNGYVVSVFLDRATALTWLQQQRHPLGE